MIRRTGGLPGTKKSNRYITPINRRISMIYAIFSVSDDAKSVTPVPLREGRSRPQAVRAVISRSLSQHPGNLCSTHRSDLPAVGKKVAVRSSHPRSTSTSPRNPRPRERWLNRTRMPNHGLQQSTWGYRGMCFRINNLRPIYTYVR